MNPAAMEIANGINFLFWLEISGHVGQVVKKSVITLERHCMIVTTCVKETMNVSGLYLLRLMENVGWKNMAVKPLLPLTHLLNLTVLQVISFKATNLEHALIKLNLVMIRMSMKCVEINKVTLIARMNQIANGSLHTHWSRKTVDVLNFRHLE